VLLIPARVLDYQPSKSSSIAGSRGSGGRPEGGCPARRPEVEGEETRQANVVNPPPVIPFETGLSLGVFRSPRQPPPTITIAVLVGFSRFHIGIDHNCPTRTDPLGVVSFSYRLVVGRFQNSLGGEEIVGHSKAGGRGDRAGRTWPAALQN